MRDIRYRVRMARPLVLTGRLLLKLRPDTIPKLQAVLGDGEHASTVIRDLIEQEIARREGALRQDARTGRRQARPVVGQPKPGRPPQRH